jgi:hypothetical protein
MQKLTPKCNHNTFCTAIFALSCVVSFTRANYRLESIRQKVNTSYTLVGAYKFTCPEVESHQVEVPCA